MSWRLLRFWTRHPRVVLGLIWTAGLVAAAVLRGRHPGDDAAADRVVDVIAYLVVTGAAFWWFERRRRPS